MRLLVTERRVEHTWEPALHDLSEALITTYGTHCGIHHLTWISLVTDLTQHAGSDRLLRRTRPLTSVGGSIV